MCASQLYASGVCSEGLDCCDPSGCATAAVPLSACAAGCTTLKRQFVIPPPTELTCTYATACWNCICTERALSRAGPPSRWEPACFGHARCPGMVSPTFERLFRVSCACGDQSPEKPCRYLNFDGITSLSKACPPDAREANRWRCRQISPALKQLTADAFGSVSHLLLPSTKRDVDMRNISRHRGRESSS